MKAVKKFLSRSTFKVGTQPSDSDVSLITIALDRDTSNNSKDDFEHRTAIQCPLYKLIKESETESDANKPDEIEEDINSDIEEIDKYSIIFEEDIPQKVLQGEQLTIVCHLYENGVKLDNIDFEVESDLLGTDKDNLYYSLDKMSLNTYILANKRSYLSDKLQLVFRCTAPNKQVYMRTVNLTLGGFY